MRTGGPRRRRPDLDGPAVRVVEIGPVPRKVLPLTLGVALLAAACGQEPVRIEAADVEGERFFVQVVDFEQDVGTGLSLSTDADGNPHLSYLAFEEQEGEAAPPAPGAAVLPAVKHAHLLENTWTRSGVAEARDDLVREDDTSIWVDQEGTHHVAWTEGGTLLYSDDTEGGEEADPQEVAPGPADGISITAAEDGTPWVSFYRGGQVQVASRSGNRWTVEPVAPADARTPRTTAIRVAGDEPIVAFGDGLSTSVARRDGGEWATEAVPGAGGLGAAMALDGDGNPHLAYYDESGAVKHAHDVGQGWEVSDVASAGAAPERGGAAIVLDAEGIHHVAWQSGAGIGYASNQEGDFAEEEVPRSEGGTGPVLGVGPEESVWLGWFDADDTEVQLALRSEDEPLLALPSPQPTLEGATPTAACEPEGTELEITAPPGAVSSGFDKDCLAVEAGTAATLAFSNEDSTIHNVVIYSAPPAEDPAAEYLGGTEPNEPVDPGVSETYDIEPVAEPGDYWFQCDFHIQTMNGTFVVAGGAGDGGQGGGGNGGGAEEEDGEG
jgi:plastocyanin